MENMLGRGGKEIVLKFTEIVNRKALWDLEEGTEIQNRSACHTCYLNTEKAGTLNHDSLFIFMSNILAPPKSVTKAEPLRECINSSECLRCLSHKINEHPYLGYS